MLRLPLKAIKDILQHVLVAPHPLILYRDSSIPATYRSHLQPSVLLICRLFYHLGCPILYGGNTLTASSPSTSINFDHHLAALPGGYRQLITKVRLEIDWAEQLWANFPLIARYLGELQSLKELHIIIISIDGQKRDDPSASTDNALSQGLTIINNGARKYAIKTSTYADIILKSEKKVFRDLVEGLKALRTFRLEGFLSDEAFARRLEDLVSGRT